MGGTNPRPARPSPGAAKSTASSRASNGDIGKQASTAPRHSPDAKASNGKSDNGKSDNGKSENGKSENGKSTIAKSGETNTTNGKSGMVLRSTIPSDFAAGREIQQQILEAVDRSGFTPHSAFAIKLALEEALINAIKHGNKLDPAKSVHIEAKVNSKTAQITIEDEGAGFDRSCVPDPTLIENLEKCSGRGILLIEAYMNSVAWTRRGRRLKMVKRNGEEPGVH